MGSLIKEAQCAIIADTFVDQWEKEKLESAIHRVGGISTEERTVITKFFSDLKCAKKSDWTTFDGSKTVWKTKEIKELLANRPLSCQTENVSESLPRGEKRKSESSEHVFKYAVELNFYRARNAVSDDWTNGWHIDRFIKVSLNKKDEHIINKTHSDK